MKTPSPDERGSALLLTLGILSLALIVAMAFAFSARLNRQIAKVNADQTKARLLAESTLNIVVAKMMMYEDDVYLPEAEASSLFNKVEDMPELAENLPALVLVKNLPAFFVSEGEDDSEYDLSHDTHILPVLGQFEWSLPEPEGSLPKPVYNTIEVDEETIGRVAYLVLEEGDKLDLNQMLSHSGKIPFVKDGEPRLRLASFTDNFSDTDFFYDILGDGTTPNTVFDTNNYFDDFENQTLRLGMQMQELRVADSYWANLPSGYTGTKTRWFSYTHLWRKLWGLEEPLEPPSDAKRYTFFSGEDIEAYWDGSTERQRFDITGTEWGGWNVKNKNNLVTKLAPPDDPETKDIDESVFQRPEFFADASRTSLNATPRIDAPGFGIPYLNSLEVATPNLGKQIAANLVDYCDSDPWATTPDSVTWTGTAEPEYCGNEKVPYFNEVALKVIAEKSDTPDFTFRLLIVPTVELVNIFAETWSTGDFQVRLIGTYKFTDMAVAANFDKTFPFTTQTINGTPFGTATATATEIHESTPGSDIPAAEYTLTITQIILVAGTSGKNDQISDFGFWQGSVSTTLTLVPNKTLDIKNASLEVTDPRLNHLSASWEWHKNDPEDQEFLSTPSNNTLGKNNSKCNPKNDGTNTDKDIETISEISPGNTFSTAFIRNAPMESLWELGAIHRGAPWQTLNLKAFASGDPNDDDFGTYKSGDAAILDQIKIGPLKYSRGKFNANSRNPLAWAELLRGIDISAGYEDAHYYGDAEGETDPPPEPNFANIGPSHSRAAVAAALAEAAAVTLAEPPDKYATDREREALIGRTANLLTTRMDKYSALVIGQALQKIDLPEGFAMTPKFKRTLVNPVQIGEDWYSLLATQRILAHIVQDAWRNEYKIVQLQIIED